MADYPSWLVSPLAGASGFCQCTPMMHTFGAWLRSCAFKINSEYFKAWNAHYTGIY
jgi:hypothetical protein